MIEIANGGSIDSVDPQYNDTEEIDLTEYSDAPVADVSGIMLVGPEEEIVVIPQKNSSTATLFFVIVGIMLLVVILVIWGIKRHGK